MNPNLIFEIIAVILFFANLGIHLYGQAKGLETVKRCTKALILGLLTVWYLVASEAPARAAAMPDSLAVAGLLFSLLGDVLLGDDGPAFFVGGTAFALAHLCYLFFYARGFSFAALPVWATAVGPAIALAAMLLAVLRLRKGCKGPIFAAVAFYMLINATTACFAFWRLTAAPSFATVIALVGAVLFFISDAVLFGAMFVHGKSAKRDVAVMSTYGMAQFFITWALILMGAAAGAA